MSRAVMRSRLCNAHSETFGRLDIAFNNAGIEQPIKPAAAISAEEWERLRAVNLRGAFVSMKHEIELMLRHGGGAIVNTSSRAGVKGFKGQAAYAATTHGLIGLTKLAALDYAASNPHQRHLPRHHRPRHDAPLHRRHR
jgi:NAD(P)-dependent dehydrogenase (short-subunit alcohol dehydrogenase family)